MGFISVILYLVSCILLGVFYYIWADPPRGFKKAYKYLIGWGIIQFIASYLTTVSDDFVSDSNFTMVIFFIVVFLMIAFLCFLFMVGSPGPTEFGCLWRGIIIIFLAFFSLGNFGHASMSINNDRPDYKDVFNKDPNNWSDSEKDYANDLFDYMKENN